MNESCAFCVVLLYLCSCIACAIVGSAYTAAPYDSEKGLNLSDKQARKLGGRLIILGCIPGVNIIAAIAAIIVVALELAVRVPPVIRSVWNGE